MSNDPREFSQLRKLMALKRHEQPPPGYFNRFSDKVIARIETEELTEFSSWWQWLVNMFDAKPVVACIYGMAVSGLLLMGFKLSERFENELTGDSSFASPWLATTPASSLIFSGASEHDSLLDSSPFSLSQSALPLLGDETGGLPWNGATLRVQPASLISHER